VAAAVVRCDRWRAAWGLMEVASRLSFVNRCVLSRARAQIVMVEQLESMAVESLLAVILNDTAMPICPHPSVTFSPTTHLYHHVCTMLGRVELQHHAEINFTPAVTLDW
jgi:hypothetical protein